MRVSPLRSIMRGYSILKKQKKIRLIRDLKDALAEQPVFQKPGIFARYFFGAAAPFAELAARQFLLHRFIGRHLDRALLLSIGAHAPVAFPLPSAWRGVVQSYGFQVLALRSWLAFSGAVFRHWKLAVRYCVSSLISGLLGKGQRLKSREPYAFFDNLAPGNLPRPGAGGLSYDFLTWYSGWSGRTQGIKILRHTVTGDQEPEVSGLRIEHMPGPVPALSGAGHLFYFTWISICVPVTVWYALTGKWWYALLLSEAAEAYRMRLGQKQDLAAEYVFHFSATTFRPLWTYEAEKKGSRVLCVFYATYEEAKAPDGYKLQKYELASTNWPEYLVWDQAHADLVARECHPPVRSEIVGPIWFTTADTSIPRLPPNAVAVFDVAPHRPSLHFGFSTLAEYHAEHPDIWIRFLDEIHQVLRAHSCTMVFKAKRFIGNRAARKYRIFCEKLLAMPDVITLDANLSAIPVIENSMATISMPFTSTALLSGYCGVPAAYFDPAGWIQKDDRAARNTPVLLGKAELDVWISNILQARAGQKTSSVAAGTAQS